jgi:hypothetical protein
MLIERLKFVQGRYELGGSSLQIARTLDGGSSYSTATVYSASQQLAVFAEGLIGEGQESLAFADQFNASAFFGRGPLPESLIMLRSSDNGQTWSAPTTVFQHTVPNRVSDCCLFRPVSGPDGTIYIPDPSAGKLRLVRSTDDALTWQQTTIGNFGGVSEPVIAAGPNGRVAVAFYKITKTTSGEVAAVRIAVSGNNGLSWHLLRFGKPFSLSGLGPKTDTSPLGPVQGIAATPTGFVAAMTVGGSLVRAGTGSAVDLVTIAEKAPTHTNKTGG